MKFVNLFDYSIRSRLLSCPYVVTKHGHHRNYGVWNPTESESRHHHYHHFRNFLIGAYVAGARHRRLFSHLQKEIFNAAVATRLWINICDRYLSKRHNQFSIRQKNGRERDDEAKDEVQNNEESLSRIGYEVVGSTGSSQTFSFVTVPEYQRWWIPGEGI